MLRTIYVCQHAYDILAVMERVTEARHSMITRLGSTGAVDNGHMYARVAC